ncbi:MAG: hypothetical protein ABIN80_13440 [Dyadobacter sp.]|uniref:hypothetical protein n=1 Tax=Dyadobacter sp. TaxID=1914288 RepID=UPI003264AD51
MESITAIKSAQHVPIKLKNTQTSTSSNSQSLMKDLIKGFCLLWIGFSSMTARAQNLDDPKVSTYESQAKKFKPENGLAARNANDIKMFVYEWFTHFEHASNVDYYLAHLNNKDMSLSFPGQAPLVSHSDYAKWYNNLLTQTLWNFHDISKIQVKRAAAHEFLVSFVIDWYGEVKATSDQLAGWQSRKDSFIYHYNLRQTWIIKDMDNQLIIRNLVVTGGETPSLIVD